MNKITVRRDYSLSATIVMGEVAGFLSVSLKFIFQTESVEYEYQLGLDRPFWVTLDYHSIWACGTLPSEDAYSLESNPTEAISESSCVSLVRLPVLCYG